MFAAPSPCSLEDLLDALERGETLLLPGAVAAGELRRAYDLRQQARQSAGWDAPGVLAWSQWTSGLWNELVVAGREGRLLLSAAQEQLLWREIVAGDAGLASLQSHDALAELAATALGRLAAYRGYTRLLGMPAAAMSSTDARTFQRWLRELDRRCGRQAAAALPTALLEEALREHLTQAETAVPEQLTLAGFVTLTPAQMGLLEALRERGCRLRFVEPKFVEASFVEPSFAEGRNAQPRQRRVVAATPQDELRMAAAFLREQLLRHGGDAMPPRLALVVPGLAAEAAEVEAALREVLAPELQWMSAEREAAAAPWQMAATAPLAAVPLVAAALDVLQWTRQALPMERVSALLLSPYVGPAGVRDAAARLDAAVLRAQPLLVPQLELRGLLTLLRGAAERQAVAVAEAAEAALAWLEPVEALAARVWGASEARSPQRSWAEWMEHARAVLEAALWPGLALPGMAAAIGARSLTVAEFEATRALDAVMDAVATLDFAGRRVSWAEALETLLRQAESTAFAAPAAQAAVRVLSPTQAEGCVWDAAVYMRCTDETLPGTELPHPLLPFALQRSLGMPGTSSAQASERAEARVKAMMQGTGELLFTSAEANDDGLLRASPLLGQLGIASVAAQELPQPEEPTARVATQQVAEWEPLPALPTGRVPGGADVLRAQAACAFQAYAAHRLGAAELEQRDLGLDPRDLGSLVHRALEYLWQQSGIHSQQELRGLSPAELERVLGACVEFALARQTARVGDATRSSGGQAEWVAAYLEMHRAQLRELLQLWVEQELQRAPFTVLSAERGMAVELGPLAFDLRIDRIDRVEAYEGEAEGDAALVLIDYKTGRDADPKDWEGERPDAPQLPLYAIQQLPGRLHALAFGRVRLDGRMGWVGLQAEDGLLPMKGAAVGELEPQLEEWRGTLLRLAEEFAGGQVRVDPKSRRTTCEHCAYGLLCRVGSLQLQAEDEDGEGDEAAARREGADA